MVVNGELPPEMVEPAPEPELGAAAAPKMPKRERGKKADKPVSNRTPKPGKCAELIAAIKAAVPETARADRMVAGYVTRVYLPHREGRSLHHYCRSLVRESRRHLGKMRHLARRSF
jgi:hypothetical protein